MKKLVTFFLAAVGLASAQPFNPLTTSGSSQVLTTAGAPTSVTIGSGQTIGVLGTLSTSGAVYITGLTSLSSGLVPFISSTSGQIIGYGNGGGGGGSGTVTNFSLGTLVGLVGGVTNPTTTPTVTLSLLAAQTGTLGGVFALAGTAHQWIYGLNAAGTFSTSQPTFADLASTPTTIAGYGITVLPWANVTGTPTTLAGYGITNALVTSGKIFDVLNSLSLSGTDGSTLNIGTGGTLGTNAFTSTAFLPLAGGSLSGGLGGSSSISAAGALTIGGASSLQGLTASSGTVSNLTAGLVGTDATGHLQTTVSIPSTSVSGLTSGTVTQVTATASNGINLIFSNTTSTPNLTLTLGTLTPLGITDTGAVTITGSGTAFTVTGGSLVQGLTATSLTDSGLTAGLAGTNGAGLFSTVTTLTTGSMTGAIQTLSISGQPLLTQTMGGTTTIVGTGNVTVTTSGQILTINGAGGGGGTVTGLTGSQGVLTTLTNSAVPNIGLGNITPTSLNTSGASTISALLTGATISGASIAGSAGNTNSTASVLSLSGGIGTGNAAFNSFALLSNVLAASGTASQTQTQAFTLSNSGGYFANIGTWTFAGPLNVVTLSGTTATYTTNLADGALSTAGFVTNNASGLLGSTTSIPIASIASGFVLTAGGSTVALTTTFAGINTTSLSTASLSATGSGSFATTLTIGTTLTTSTLAVTNTSTQAAIYGTTETLSGNLFTASLAATSSGSVATTLTVGTTLTTSTLAVTNTSTLSTLYSGAHTDSSTLTVTGASTIQTLSGTTGTFSVNLADTALSTAGFVTNAATGLFGTTNSIPIASIASGFVLTAGGSTITGPTSDSSQLILTGSLSAKGGIANNFTLTNAPFIGVQTADPTGLQSLLVAQTTNLTTEVFTFTDGTTGWHPGVGYGGLFIADFWLTASRFPQAFPPGQIRNVYRKFVDAAALNTGSVSGVIPISITSTNAAPLNTFSGYDPNGVTPTGDGRFLAPVLMNLYYKETLDTTSFAADLAVMNTNLNAIPMTAGGQYVNVAAAGSRWVPWGFQDAVAKTGSDLMGTLLMYQADVAMAANYTAIGSTSAATAYTTSASSISAALGTTSSTLWDATDGMFYAATGQNKLPDFNGSALAVSLGIPTANMSSSISSYMATNAAVNFNTSGFMLQTITTSWTSTNGSTYDNGFWSWGNDWALKAIAANSTATASAIAASMSSASVPNQTAEYFTQGAPTTPAGATFNLESPAGTMAYLFTGTASLTLSSAGTYDLWGNANVLGNLYTTGSGTYGGTLATGGNLTVTNGTETISWGTNGAVGLNVYNPNAGGGAVAIVSLSNGNASAFQLGKLGTGYSTYKILTASSSYLYNSGGGDFDILNDFASGGLKIAVGGSTTAQWSLSSAGAVTLTGSEAISSTLTVGSAITGSTTIAVPTGTFSTGVTVGTLTASSAVGMATTLTVGTTLTTSTLAVTNTSTHSGATYLAGSNTVSGTLNITNLGTPVASTGFFLQINTTSGLITSSTNSAGGGDTITSPNGSLTIGGTSTNTTVDIALGHANVWTGAQSLTNALTTISSTTVTLASAAQTWEVQQWATNTTTNSTPSSLILNLSNTTGTGSGNLYQIQGPAASGTGSTGSSALVPLVTLSISTAGVPALSLSNALAFYTGTGPVTVGGATTLSGATTVSGTATLAGVTTIGTNTFSLTSTASTFSGAAITFSGTSVSISPTNVSFSGTALTNNVANTSYSGAAVTMSPTTLTLGGTTVTGSAALRLTGAATLSGALTLSGQASATPTSFLVVNSTNLTGTTASPLVGAYGGTGLTGYTSGDTLYGSGSSTLSKLAIGSTGQILTVASGLPSWAAPPGTPIAVSVADKTVTSTTSEVSIIGTLAAGGSQTTAANYFAAGTSLRFELSGFFQSAVTDTLTIKLKAGSTAVASTGAVAYGVLSSNKVVRLIAVVTCRTTGSSGTFQVNTFLETGGSALAPQEAQMLNSSAVTLDTTGTLAWDVTAQWSASSASDTITGTNFVMASPTGGSNRPVAPSIQVVTSASTITANAITDDGIDVTALAVGTTFANPSNSGSLYDGQKLIITILDNGGAQTLAWGTTYDSASKGGIALPSTTVAGKLLQLGFRYTTVNSINKFILVASAQGL